MGFHQISKFFIMKLIVVVYVLASALATMGDDLTATDVELQDALQEMARAAEDFSKLEDEEQLNEIAKLLRMEDSLPNHRDADTGIGKTLTNIVGGLKKVGNTIGGAVDHVFGKKDCSPVGHAASGSFNRARCGISSVWNKFHDVVDGKKERQNDKRGSGDNLLARLLQERR